ncbi:MAG: hypothetical protein PHE56_06735 [Bacteroidales bacterium]|nr:hypothetical protein [Bacteroidales bacterium]
MDKNEIIGLDKLITHMKEITADLEYDLKKKKKPSEIRICQRSIDLFRSIGYHLTELKQIKDKEA